MRDLWSETAVHVCEVDGCDAHAPAGRYCARCTDEIEALDSYYAERAASGASAFRRLCQAVRKRFWVVNVIVVGVGLLYLGWKVGDVLIEWIRAGGVQ